MPVTVLFLLATLAIIVAGTLPETPVLIYRGMLQIDRFGLFVSGVCVLAATLDVISAPSFCVRTGWSSVSSTRWWCSRSREW